MPGPLSTLVSLITYAAAKGITQAVIEDWPAIRRLNDSTAEEATADPATAARLDQAVRDAAEKGQVPPP